MIFKFFCKSNEIFNKNNKVFFFSYSFFTFVQNFKQNKKKFIMTCVFECFQTHCHITKELHEFLCMMMFQESLRLWLRSMLGGCIKFYNKPFHPNRLIKKGTCSISVQVFDTNGKWKKENWLCS